MRFGTYLGWDFYMKNLVYRWNDKFEKNLTKLNTVHSCRNFDEVRDWAFERWVEEVTVESEVHASHQHHDVESDEKEVVSAEGHHHGSP